MAVPLTTALATDLDRLGHLRRELSNLRQAFWAVAREEQGSSRRLERQMGALFEGLGNVIADVELDRTGNLPRTVTELKLELQHQLDCNVCNNIKA